MESGKAEKLRQRIISDAEDEARKIVEEGQGEAGRVKAEADARAQKIGSEFAQKAKSQAEEYVRRQISLGELEARKAILAEKGALIDEVFEKALEELRARDRKGGYALTRKLMLDAIEVGDEEVILSGEDRGGIGRAFIDDLNGELRKAGKRGEVKISEETREIRGGFVLRRGRVESNASFDTLLAMLRDEIETDVASILFGGGGGKA
jgi:V/A-type H+-transporting ATPase subunit E